MSLIRPPFPPVIDNSLLSSFRSCPQKCLQEYFLHWKPRTPNVHLHAGKAWARAMEVTREEFFVKGASSQDAIAAGLRALIHAYGDFECPPDSPKSLERLCGALEYSFSTYPLESEKAIPAHFPGGGRGIEFSHTEPLEIAHPETGDPLLYTGRFDQIVEWQGGLWGFDDKTTSSLGASWPKQWDLRAQFTGYVWLAKSIGIDLSGFLIRGISILKTKYETLQPITYRPAWMVEAWYEQVHRTLRRMIQCWEEGYWDYDWDEACTSYGGCVFRKVCLSAPDARQGWLETDFEKRRWDPVLRIEAAV